MNRSVISPPMRLTLFGFIFGYLLLQYCFPIVSGAPKYNSLKKRLENYELEADPTSSSSSVNQRRGLRQRMEDREAQQEQQQGVRNTEGPWTQTLKRDWASGQISAIKVQEYAENSAAQGATGMERISAAGAHGKHQSSVHKSLMRLFGRPKGAPEIEWIEIPLKGGRRVPHPFILPHKFFRALHKERYANFVRALRGPEGAAEEYWSNLRQTDFVRRHPLLSDRKHSLPIGMHGDAGPYSKQDSLMVISWNSLLGTGTTRTKRFVFTFLRKVEYNRETLDRVWQVLAWSFNAMARGEDPAIDWDGNPISALEGPLAGPYTGVLTQIRGDWQFYVEIFQFPPWNGAIRMCWMCRASSVIRRLAFTDTSEEAGWRGTKFTDESYRRYMRGLGLAIPLLLALVLGLRLECISIDALHSLDLGFSAHITANTFWESIRRHCWGASDQPGNAALLDKAMIEHCKANNVPSRIQGQLTTERIRSTSDSGYPKLKAKGAQVRHLAPFSLEVARRFARPGDPATCPEARHDQLIIALNQLLCELYRIMATSSQFFTEAAKVRIQYIGNAMPQLYQQLYANAARLGVKAWKMTPKAHIVQELLIYQCQVWGNPAYYWCYCDEDLVGLTVEIAQSCHPSTLCVVALVKWLVLCFDCEPEEE